MAAVENGSRLILGAFRCERHHAVLTLIGTKWFWQIKFPRILAAHMRRVHQLSTAMGPFFFTYYLICGKIF